MLILTRRVGETLMIGDEVSVTVLGVKGNQVRLGVNAPKDIAVHREEIYQRILHERTEPGRPPQDHPAASPHQTGERLGLNRPHDTNERGYPRQGHAMNERGGSLNPLENGGFGPQSGGFNPSFDPFEDDYYNR